jgi:uroporphyrinogen III methyltransferase/synthase
MDRPRARLRGRVVATTRDGRADDTLVLALRAEGAEVRVWPTLKIDGPEDPGPLEDALADLGGFDWIAFTSARAVDAVAERVPAPQGHPQGRPRVAAVGEATAEALSRRGWAVDAVGDGDGATGLVTALAEAGLERGARVLFPAGSLARDVLDRELRELGAEVRRVEAYRTTPTPPDGRTVHRDLIAVDVAEALNKVGRTHVRIADTATVDALVNACAELA